MPDWLVTTTAAMPASLSRAHRLRGAGQQAHLVGVPEIVRRPRSGCRRDRERPPAAPLTPGAPARARGRSPVRRLRAACAGRAARGRRPPERRRRDRRAGGGAPARRRRAGRDRALTRVVGSTAPGNAPPPTADSPALERGAELAPDRRRPGARARAASVGRHRASACAAPGSRAPRSRGPRTARAWPRGRPGSACRPACARASGFSRQRATSVAPPHEAAGLRPAQQLVAAEEHEARAGRERVGHPRLGRQAPGREVRQQAAAHVDTGRGRPPPPASAASAAGSGDATNPRCSKFERWTVRIAADAGSSAAR